MLKLSAVLLLLVYGNIIILYFELAYAYIFSFHLIYFTF